MANLFGLDFIKAAAAARGVPLINYTGGEYSRQAAPPPAPAAAAPAPQTNLSQFLGINSTPGVFGNQAFDRAVASGLTPDQVRNLAAQQGLMIGSGVQGMGAAQQAAAAPNNLSQFLGANSTPGVFGEQAFNRALESGLTDAQIRSLASAQGLSIGAGAPAAAAMEAMPKFSSEKGLGQNLKSAGSTLSQKELQKIAKATGKTTDKVLEKAVQKGLSIGSKVVNQYSPSNGLPSEVIQFTNNKGMDIAFDFLRGNPILQQIRDAPKLDKGSKLSVSSKGSTATVLPRTIATQPNNRMKSQVSAPVPEVVPTAEQAMTPTSGIEDFLNQLAGQSEEPMASAMPALEGFEDVSSDFDIKDPLQFASLGQSYLTDAIRAARRRAQSRRDYMRTMMMMAMMPNMSPLGIGGGLNVG